MTPTATHQAKFAGQFDVAAWQFSLKGGMPDWVAKKFHLVESGFAARSSDGRIVAKIGDWAVCVLEESKITVLTNAEFNQFFIQIPGAPR